MNTDNIIHPKHRSDNFVNIIAGGNKLILIYCASIEYRGKEIKLDNIKDYETSGYDC